MDGERLALPQSHYGRLTVVSLEPNYVATARFTVANGVDMPTVRRAVINTRFNLNGQHVLNRSSAVERTFDRSNSVTVHVSGVGY